MLLLQPLRECQILQVSRKHDSLSQTFSAGALLCIHENKAETSIKEGEKDISRWLLLIVTPSIRELNQTGL